MIVDARIDVKGFDTLTVAFSDMMDNIGRELIKEMGFEAKRQARKNAPNKHIRDNIGKRTERRINSFKLIVDTPDASAWEFGYGKPITVGRKSTLENYYGEPIVDKLDAFDNPLVTSVVIPSPSSPYTHGPMGENLYTGTNFLQQALIDTADKFTLHAGAAVNAAAERFWK